MNAVKIHMRKCLLSLFLLLYSLSACAQKNNMLVIAHVSVIDCTGAAAKPNSTVVVTGGLITAVGPSETITVPTGARVVEANGKFLIPGLWDMHGHLTDATEDAFPLLIMNGVTGVRDMGGVFRLIFVGATKLTGAISCLIPRFPMSQAEQYRHNGQDERTDHARFGTHCPSRQPPRSVQSYVEEVVRRGESAVGHPIEECLAPVIAEVKAHRAP
jgi:hypothetical protein